MSDRERAEIERIVTSVLLEHDAHGFGEFSVKTTPDAVTITAGKIWRVKKSLDRKERSI